MLVRLVPWSSSAKDFPSRRFQETAPSAIGFQGSTTVAISIINSTNRIPFRQLYRISSPQVGGTAIRISGNKESQTRSKRAQFLSTFIYPPPLSHPIVLRFFLSFILYWLPLTYFSSFERLNSKQIADPRLFQQGMEVAIYQQDAFSGAC